MCIHASFQLVGSETHSVVQRVYQKNHFCTMEMQNVERGVERARVCQNERHVLTLTVAQRPSSAAHHEVMSPTATRYESRKQHEKLPRSLRPLERLV